MPGLLSIKALFFLFFVISVNGLLTPSPTVRRRQPSQHSHTVLNLHQISSTYETFGDGALAEKSFVELYSPQEEEAEDEDGNEGNKNILPRWLTQRCLECGWTYPTIVQVSTYNILQSERWLLQITRLNHLHYILYVATGF